MKKITSFVLALILLLGLCASALGAEEPAGEIPTEDPSGAAIEVPEKIESIVTLGPSLAEMVTALGRADQIVGYDTNCQGLEGLDPDAAVFDLMEPDMEQLAALEADLVLVTNMSLYDEQSPFQPLVDLGVCVACVPNSDSIQGIERDIAFVAAVLGEQQAGQELIGQMQEKIDRIAAIGQTIPDGERKSVYFEISAAPYMYSFGSQVYLDEMIEIIGAKNILAGQEGWLSVEAETVVAADPDVILTNVNYIDDPVGEILSRDGWDGVRAVADGQVYAIDANASSVPDQNIVTALEQMAQAVYPEYFQP